MHAEYGKVHRAGAIHPGATCRDFLQQDRRLGDAEPVTAVFLRRGDAEPAALSEGVVELRGELVLLVLGHPVVVIKLARQLRHSSADRLLILAEFEVLIVLQTAGWGNRSKR